MKKVIVAYQSKTGTTKKYGEEIAKYLGSKKLNPNAVSIEDCNMKLVEEADVILLGCWTAGLMLFLQHPEKKWVTFAKSLPAMHHKKIGLFTTYKLATGSMFGKMRKHIGDKVNGIQIELKSKHGELSESDKKILDQLIN